MIRVLVADDSALVRRSIRVLLDRADGIEVVGEASDGHATLGMVAELEPDLVLMDISMPRLDGLSATARIHLDNSSTQVLILSMYASQSLTRQALQNGARGYLLKRNAAEELVLAIRQVLQGEIYLSPALENYSS
jgi:DNA-binding NarL/FixJ family response regulator